jgi:hypothetical protein
MLDIVLRCILQYISKIRVKFHQIQQCVLLLKPLHVSVNDGYHQRETNTSKEVLQRYYMHLLSCKVETLVFNMCRSCVCVFFRGL